MAKRALLCGCNYPGSSHALNGCVNDVNAMYSMLTTHFGFAPENITKLIDTDPSGEQPTGANIKVNTVNDRASAACGIWRCCSRIGKTRWIQFSSCLLLLRN